MLFPVPSLPEQTAIVRFLDYMDRRIRRSIRAKQKLIKLLDEYRQALIHQAVTGQIDVRTGKPYPAYKDSGVEWLGEVPAHWGVRRLKTVVNHVNEQTTTKTDEDLYIALEHVESWTGRLLPPSGEAHFDGQVKRFQAGDVLFGKLRPYLAKVVRPKQSGVCVGEFLVLRPMTILSPLYLEVVLRSAPAIDFMNSSTYGAKMPRVEWTFVGAMLFPVPPLPEQTAIVEHLDAQTAKLDAAIAAARREIELLREYRERLIADVVTGKLDVRALAERLPAEPPPAEAPPEAEAPAEEEGLSDESDWPDENEPATLPP
jgi:type I restriction enzyme S subunit